MTILELIRQVCARLTLPPPSSAVGSQDAQVSQLVGLLNELGEDLMTRKAFTANTQEALWTSNGLVDQGMVDDIAPGFVGFKSDTFWNRTTNLPLGGPIPDDSWQRAKSSAGLAPYSRYRLLRGRLLLDRPVPQGHTLAFEYYSSYFFQDQANNLNLFHKQYITRDDDTFILNDALAMKWLQWKWKSAKGLDYAEDFSAYERLVGTLIVRQGDAPVVNLASPSLRTRLEVPSGNWIP